MAETSFQDHGLTPAINVSLSSNNPFRRATSPVAPSSNTPLFSGRKQLHSTNPFLDDYKVAVRHGPSASQRTQSASRGMGATRQSAYNDDPAPLVNGLTLSDKPPSQTTSLSKASPTRAGTMPVTHRPTRSQDEEMQIREDRRSHAKSKELDIFASPQKHETRRPRRNSETSVLDAKGVDRARRHGERKYRDRDGKSKDDKSRPAKPRKPNAQLDLIDKLDVTGIYGPALFHHDGPFDACNPHRNRKGSKAPPMQAFPEGSSNNTLGGAGPVNRDLDLDKFHGRAAEGFTDFNNTTSATEVGITRPHVERSQSFNPKVRDHIHGEESMGLGTSTFLEGAPAPRAALQRHEFESDQTASGSIQGLQRKRSLAQKIRGMSRPRQGFGEPGNVTSPEARYLVHGHGLSTSPTSATPGPLSAGGMNKIHEYNPFFDGQNDAGPIDDASKKGTVQTHVTELPPPRQDVRRGRSNTDTEQPLPLGRHMTNDSTNDEGRVVNSGGGGLLSRVRSFKGGRRGRAEKTIA